MTSSVRILPTLTALLLLPALSGCGEGRGTGNEGGLSGTVRVDGSSTVYPITEAVAEEFMIENSGVQVNVGVSGTGGGFAKFGRGEIDIADASRPIKPAEVEAAQAAGISFIELPIAYDGLAVAANPQNTWVDCLTLEELRKIWAPGSTVTRWSDVRPGFPDQEIKLFGPGTDSGTFDYFTAAVNGEEGASRTNYSNSEDDNTLVQGVAGTPGSLGYFGYAYYAENQDKLKLIGIDDGNPANGEGCVKPGPETVRSGQYQPLARPEFIYVSAARADDPTVRAFVEFYLANAPALVQEVGYIPLSDEAYQRSLERFREKRTGSLFHGSEPGVTIEELYRRENEGTGAADSTAPPAQDSAAVPAQ